MLPYIPLGICAFCYMWNLFGVVVFNTSMVNWGGGYICPKHMCILLYVKCIWCSGIPEIHGQLEEGTFCYVWNLFSVVVLHRSKVSWRREVLSTCVLCYLWKFFGVAVFHTSMVHWIGSICPQYICILLYVKLLWCTGISEIYGQLEEGGILLCVKIIWCMVFHTSIVNWRRGFAICASYFLWNFFAVVVFQRSMII